MASEHSPGLAETVTKENGGTEQKMIKEHLFSLMETVTEGKEERETKWCGDIHLV